MSILTLWRDEPVRVVSFVIAALAVAASFGIDVSDVQIDKIAAAIFAAAALLGGEVARRKVTPV